MVGPFRVSRDSLLCRQPPRRLPTSSHEVSRAYRDALYERSIRSRFAGLPLYPSWSYAYETYSRPSRNLLISRVSLRSGCKQPSLHATRPSVIRRPKTSYRPLHLPRRHIGVNAARFPLHATLSDPTRIPPSSSLELFQRTAPLPTTPCASTPRVVQACAIPPPSIGGYQPTDSFRPRRFSRPQRFTPHRALQVYCTLLPVMGSARFPSLPFTTVQLSEDNLAKPPA